MSDVNWAVNSSNRALDFISDEFNKLEDFKEGLGERFFDLIEEAYTRIKINPLQFESKTKVYRKALVNVTRKLQYAIYFRITETEVFVDLILPTASNPDLHPSE